MADQQYFHHDDGVVALLKQWGGNFQRNSSGMFKDMNAKNWIRIVIVVGTYLLLRPYIIKLGARQQAKMHERDSQEEVTDAKIHPNDLRGGKKVAIPGLDSDDEEVQEAKPAQWGKKARVRQRKFIRTAVEKEEERLRQEQEDEEDKDIQEFLVD